MGQYSPASDLPPVSSQKSPNRTNMRFHLLLLLLLTVVAQQIQGSDECSYECSGWPNQKCITRRGNAWASCIAPFKQGIRVINYPKCATFKFFPCQRCDDVCAIRDGKRGKNSYHK